MSFIEDFLFPKKCVNCSKPGSYLCLACFSKIKYLQNQFCPYCGKPSIDGHSHPSCRHVFGLDGLLSVSSYQKPIDSLIKTLKYQRVSDLRKTTSQIVNNFLQDEEDYFPQDALVTSVPLHFFKKNIRGFNQSDLLGEAVAESISAIFNPDLLKRTRYTGSQVSLKKEGRLANVRGAFSLNVPKEVIVDKYIVLVDDVWTTGSTLKECSIILKKNGADRVWALTLAREDRRS